ncbi:class I adenylate-forming enzyme family protein [Aquibium microcysteis]|uniref:class I adenylate-forming enzyme family protein n=1 Tax=Aquibium microcysteis TaxID=675281 RepID=UPI00165CFAD8|nr:class I adenylate-forming enzyme family protein [Aquibium microcysteis]
MNGTKEPDWRAMGLWRDDDLWSSFVAAADGPGRNATVRDEAGTVSLSGLLAAALRVAGGYRAAGVGAGDAVVVQARNSIDAYAAVLAGFSQGIVAVPVPPMFSPGQLIAVASNSNARAMVLLEEGSAGVAAELLSALPDLKAAFVGDRVPQHADARMQPWANARDAAPAPASPPGPDADALVLYSSGSTGAPKGVVHSGNSLRFAIEALARFHEVAPADRVLVVLEFGFVGGTVLGALLAFMAGASTVLMRKWDAGRCMSTIERERCTYTLLMPTHVYDVVNHPALGAVDCSSMRRAILAGGSTEQRRRATGAFCAIALPMYGMSESMAHCTCALDDPEEMRVTVDGRALPGTEMRILTEAGQPALPGETGRVYLRGPNRLRRYQSRPDLNERVIDADGWFDTGDKARVSEGGCMTFQGRASEVIRRGGMMIQPAEVEAAFRGMSGVAEVAVIGIPDERLGERACACILSHDLAPDLESMRAHLQSVGLPRYQWPELLLNFREFPRTPSLKVRRADLALLAREQLGKLHQSEGLLHGSSRQDAM